ncbi:OPT family oligopeptide transporter [Legionella longbeachae]|uniref:Putative transporters n=1 Tax=Legionella longbeachae serogroup 1 (strain NSW150) TaxID=661367 RepID=D3HQJ2_LEGLN|nr:oligopeptide transporter, OPT family [Legionella longbeachae]HBD7396437.1 oligopeptide transporter, OPT family [Legionella pneumophila]EEZ95726.1 OPT family oligopeptide transporter [Legionella longbeachae D-4968]QEY50777.1 oligopeptide transporter, OPT family [Legionella longbeachae]QIN31606.1 oligopeptide transporter, OPT family [Legionella longbeachae]QIN34949.1 oligopeptide transporter, OPT family [Legionella longbeachae]
MADTPFIATDKKVPELTVRVILLAIILTVLLAMSNAYLALKLGILTSASIPAAIISMGILRFFKNSTILENNAVQTAASAGEAVAGGIVYTIPALIIIGFWNHFDYLTNFFIAVCGGILGVLFSIPLRRILVHDQSLKFPEGRAIAEVLKSSVEKSGINDILIGGAIGGFIELLQTGFKIIANSWGHWFVVKRSLFGLGAGFSATMIGAGYLVGHDMAISIFLGAVISWLIALPVVSHIYPDFINQYPPEQAASFLWNSQMRYMGIGAMLFAGVWTFLKLIKPLSKNIRASLNSFSSKGKMEQLPRIDKDIPLPYILIGIGSFAAILFLFFQLVLPLGQAGLDNQYSPTLIFLAVLYVLFIGFIFSVITAYFSGMVGVTASPGSSVVISGMLFAAWLLLVAIDHLLPLPLSTEQIQAAEAITIMIGSVVTGIAAIANDNTQDLKVGQLVGATPWKQQLMLLLGVVISSLVIPPVMQLLFEVYGIAGVMPLPNMDINQSLPAPTAALMAAITEAVFRNSLPWAMMLIGSSIILIIVFLNHFFQLRRYLNLSILGVAIGMYLPISSSFPLFIGGMIAFWVNKRLNKNDLVKDEIVVRKQKGTLIACGLVAGSAIMDVLLAIPFSIWHSPDALQLVGNEWKNIGVYLGILSTLLLAWWINHRVCRGK